MSRSSHQRNQQKLHLQQQQQQQQQLLAQQQIMADNEAAAAAAEMFDLFCVATTMRQVLGLHRNMCDLVGLRPAPFNEFYPKLKAKIRSWKAQALWKKFDARAAHRAYAKGNAATGTRVLVIGAGPCGLRSAIEAQLLGAKVVVVEKRDRISRNNVLHLWPFVITDLRNLGAKKFYGKFCAGSIDHISIRQLQCILLKVALLLGVEVHEGVSFESTIEPSGDGNGWHASVSPADHAVSHYEFDVLIGADGKRNTLEGFKRKEFRGKLAIAITANFINKKTEAEAKAEEISGVAFIFNQSFFKELYYTTGIDLENIVYYKDETHYFVMTAKKHSLIDKGVIMQDFADPAELLAPANVNTEKLLDYAREAAEFSTKYQMPNLEFAVNHYGKPDVAMFDFTSMFAAETSCRVIVRKGFRLMQCLVGDSLLEPFWPTGSGCARGFLSSMDAAYAIKLWSNPRNSTLGVLAQRESIYRLLNQTTPENLQRDIGSYTVDPATRYPNLNRTSVNVWQVKHLIDTDDKAVLEQTFMDTNVMQTMQVDTPVRRKRRSGDSQPLSTVLLRWICAQLHSYEFTKSLKEVSDVFTNGKVLCALINRYRPDLVDFNAVKDLSLVECNETAFEILEKELNIPQVMSGQESLKLNGVESKLWLNYLEQICEAFRGEIPHVKHPKMDFSDLRQKYRINSSVNAQQADFSNLLKISTKQKNRAAMTDMVDVPQTVQRRSVLDEDKLKRQRKAEHAVSGGASAAVGATCSGQQVQTDTPRRAKKRRSAEKTTNIEERQKRLQEIEQNRQDRLSRRRQQRNLQTQNFYKSLHMLQANNWLREGDDESAAFEDYSIFLYRQQAPEFNDRVKDLERKLLYPDRDRSDIPSALPRSNTDEQFSDRIKSMEQRITSRNTYGSDKKPKDLLRAIGKIDSSDWNVREIEKKIEQSKKTEIHGPKGREKVPKWSKEQFLARQHKMSKPQRQDSGEEKFKEIDQTLKNLDKQLKEGRTLEVGERGRNKVASIAGQFVKKDDNNTSDEKNPPTVVPKSSSKVALAFKKQAASEKCHFCKQTVYLMEKINTEGLILHRSCLKCHHCDTNLRLGSYAFDRDDPNGRFYCTQHYRLPAKARPVMRKPGQRKPTQQQQQAAAAAASAAHTTAIGADEVEPQTPDKLRVHADNVAQMDLLDRGQTPERIEFENTDAMSDGEPSEEHIIDEHEWSGRNFLPVSNNDSESDLSSSDESDTDTDSDMFEEANDSPLGAQTLQLATDWIGKQNYTDSDDSDDFYDSSEGIADDGKDDTEGEEFKKARELRREEVRLLPLPANLPTDTETELQLKQSGEKDRSVEVAPTKEEMADNVNVNIVKLPIEDAPITSKDVSKDVDRVSLKSNNSANSFKSAASLAGIVNSAEAKIPQTPPPTKADIEKLEQSSDRKLSVEIDVISEKLYHLNNVMKMNKEIGTMAKENLVRGDIQKKLTLKEKWLADNNVGNMTAVAPKSKFEESTEKLTDKASDQTETDKRLADIKKRIEESRKQFLFGSGSANASENKETKVGETETVQKDNEESKQQLADNKENVSGNMEQIAPNSQTDENATQNLMSKSPNLGRRNSFKKSNETPSNSPTMAQNQSSNVSRANSFKSNASSSPKLTPKSGNVSRSNSLKGKKEPAPPDSKMELEQILDIVKKMDISNEPKEASPLESSDAEAKFTPPKPNRRMKAKLKEIQATSFADTMDTIKSQIDMPTVSSQASGSAVDLSKYFPNQKQEKGLTGAVNKNQKNLKDVDLTKYFPSSPVAPKRAVVTVADKLRKSQTEKSLGPITSIAKEEGNVEQKKTAPKRQNTTENVGFSLREHQLDGAVDLAKKKAPMKSDNGEFKKNTPASVKTTAATATATKKGNVKIIKKIVPKGAKGKKAAEAESSKALFLVPRDESDLMLDEVLNADRELFSPTREFQNLFNEEKSPSEDISDKIESILEETGIDLGIPRKEASHESKNKLLKTQSLGEQEFERSEININDDVDEEEDDRPKGVQNILKRFESMKSGKPEENVFKLRRMESTTSNLNRSRESLVSKESDSMSDLEKTMEYLKTEWRSEATNFLQKKRTKFFTKKRSAEKEVATKAEEQKKSKYGDMPVQYRESKISKFFGINQQSPEKKKSPEKRKSPLKTKSPEKMSGLQKAKSLMGVKLSAPKEKSPAKDTTNTKMIHSLEEVARLRGKQPDQSKSENATVIGKLTKSINVNESSTPLKPDSNNAVVSLNTKNLIAKVSQETTSVPRRPENKESVPYKSETQQTSLDRLESTDITTSKETNTDTTKKIDTYTSQKIVTVPANNKSDITETAIPNEILSENTKTVEPVKQEDSSTVDNQPKPRPLVEDIRNLPKTGCDKSRSNSRRSSLASLQSRRCSDSSLTEKLDIAAEFLKLAQENPNDTDKKTEEVFKHIVDALNVKQIASNDVNRNITDDLKVQQPASNEIEDEVDSLCTSISKSPSAAPVTVQYRGSSEEESIEKLFSQFSDQMLVNVEFDSNDELVSITPRVPPTKNEIVKGIESDADADRDYIGKLESLERDDVPIRETISQTKTECAGKEQLLADAIVKAELKQPNKLNKKLLPCENNEIKVKQLEQNESNDRAERVAQTATSEQHKKISNTSKLLHNEPTVKHDEAIQQKAELESLDKFSLQDFACSQDSLFPIRPQRRQKSRSSSSETSAPIAPQRAKRKLSKLSATDTTSSVQDLLQEMYSDQTPTETTTDNSAKKFPHTHDEDGVVQETFKSLASQEDCKAVKIKNNEANCTDIFQNGSERCSTQASPRDSRDSSVDKRQATAGTDPRVYMGKDVAANLSRQNLKSTEASPAPSETQSKSQIENRAAASVVDTNQQHSKDAGSAETQSATAEQQPSTQTSFMAHMHQNYATNADRRSSLKALSPESKQTTITPATSISNAPSPGFTTPKDSVNTSRRSSKVSYTDTTNIETLPKAQSKESSVATEGSSAIKLLPRDGSAVQEVKLREFSPTTSIQILNNLQVKDDTEEAKQLLMEKTELERRQALSKRDKMFEERQKVETEQRRLSAQSSNNSSSRASVQSSNKSTQSNGSSKKSSPHKTPASGSIRSTQERTVPSKDGTPPMFKKLELPSDNNTTTESSRRSSLASSFAMIELSADKEPVIVPMPKKLHVPKPQPPKYVPDSDEPVAEVFANRSWPKSQDDKQFDLGESGDELQVEPSKSPSPIAAVFKNRQWPDGKTIFSREGRALSLEEGEEVYSGVLKLRPERRKIPLQRSFEKPSSQSYLDLTQRTPLTAANIDKVTSKSYMDLERSSSPSGGYQSPQSFYAAPRSSRSSTETERSADLSKYRPRSVYASTELDAGTRILLDRSKHLHDRKRNFLNERATERNPYMRDVYSARGTALVTDEQDLDSYRPRHYTGTVPRFSTAATRHYGRGDYDYRSSPTTGTDYGSSSTRRLHTLPTSTLGSSYYHYPSTTTTTPYSSTARGTHFIDYFKRSPSQHREREHSKESCVQSESDTSSPDKVELNSATEISTDSEFDHDEIIRETPKIYINDTHLRNPTKVQVKSTVIPPSKGHKHHHHQHHHNHASSSVNNAQSKGGSYLQKYQVTPPQPQFKPLVQVDPTLLNTNRTPLQNPRPGDYLLNKTASTEGIASKKSLELKKRYLLGEQANGNKIQKSGSTSVLDSKIRSFQSNISECQKLLNTGSGVKTLLDRTKLVDGPKNDLMRSATTNILNDLKVEITIQKASSTASTDNEKENVFVNSKNELNKGMEYSEQANTTLLDSMPEKREESPMTPTNDPLRIETVDLVTPTENPILTVDLTEEETPPVKLETSKKVGNANQLLSADSNRTIIDLTGDSPLKSDKTIMEDVEPDVSKDVKQAIPDILGHIEHEVNLEKLSSKISSLDEERQTLVNNSDDEKRDSPEKLEEQYEENETLQIEVPNIPWKTRKTENMSSTTTTGSSCSSNSSSVEDIQHFILESTTSPDTQTSGVHQVPRVEIHDTSGTLMQVDSLMIIDGKYVGDPEDLKYMEIPEGVMVPEVPAVKTSEVEDETELDAEPVTATPEPAEHTVIEKDTEQVPPLPEQGPPLPDRGPPKLKTVNLKFDTKNENKIESLQSLPLIVENTVVEQTKAVKPISLNLAKTHKKSPVVTPTTPTASLRTPTSPLYVDHDKTPTAELLSKGSDSETEATGTGQALTETELSDWTADDCISENFVDMEFVVNSNKGTIKRNKKDSKKKSNYSKLPSTSEMLNEVAKTAPVAEFEGILKCIDIDDIEFMDTGSEGSCAEAYTATNTAMLLNRGFAAYIETTPKPTPSHKVGGIASEKYPPLGAKRDEKLGIDYIEQGVYILDNELDDELLKTPINESPQILAAALEKAQSQPSSVMTQSLTDTSTLNDLDDDSLCMVTPSSLTQLSSLATTTKTTTEESDALTIVTSPVDSSSPKAQDLVSAAQPLETPVGSTTPSSSEKNPKTSQSTCTPISTGSISSNKAALAPAALPIIGSLSTTATSSNSQRKPSDEISYEEYVRALQQKITQISTARDSLDTRKQRRKSSKIETAATTMSISNNTQTVIEQTALMTPNQQQEEAPDDMLLPATQVRKVPEIPTLTRKLEEITKERTKQKDLIHDLVMDKLQSKKQLNAEKRLHRSRQRTLVTSGYNSGSSLSPTPQLAAATTTTDTNCTNQAHYHVSTAQATTATTVPLADRPSSQRVLVTISSSFKENNPLEKSASFATTYGGTPVTSTRYITHRQRPFSEHLDPEHLDNLERHALSKTPSFSFATAAVPQSSLKSQHVPMEDDTFNKFTSPLTPPHQTRAWQTNMPMPSGGGDTVYASTENLRSEARARARLKSNTELGLSPEEKMEMLRRRLHFEQAGAKYNVSVDTANTPSRPYTQSAEARERKMSASKSVNDLAYFSKQQQSPVAEYITQVPAAKMDFTSDPNLLLSSTSPEADVKPLKTKPNRRAKDPDRRKSLIQSLSSFFHKNMSTSSSNHNGKEKHGNVGITARAAHSAQTESTGTSGSSIIAPAGGGGAEGVFSRFRISPKSKEKSKDKDVYPLNATSATTTTATTVIPHERSISQDCIMTPHNTRNNNHGHAHSRHHNHNNSYQKSSSPTSRTAATMFSSSSPQLFVNRTNYYMATAADDQTPPPIPPLPLNYQRSDDESLATDTREQKKQRAISKAVRQAELKRLRIAQEIQREQEEIEVQLKELEARGVFIEKALRGEAQNLGNLESSNNIGSNDEKLLKELLEIWRNITQLKKRDEELAIRQQELQLEHRHAQLKEELNLRLSSNKLDKSSADVAAEGAILNEMLEIVAKRAALRPTTSNIDLTAATDLIATTSRAAGAAGTASEGFTLRARRSSLDNEESNI